MSKAILSYQGPLSFSTIDWLLGEFKLAAQDNEIPFRTYKRMISIMIEALENIYRYSARMPCNGKKKPGTCPSCRILQNASDIELITTNPVRKEDVDTLRSRIEMVNNLHKEELKELYRSTLTNGEFTSGGGAGLGLIEMARTTGNKLEYRFENLSGDYSLYTFRVHFSM